MSSLASHGGSSRDFGSIYSAGRQIQLGRNYYFGQGKGLGDVFRGVFNFLSPFLKSGTRAIGSELLKGGAEVLDGLSSGNRKFGDLVKEQKDKRIKNLGVMAQERLRKFAQTGSGLHRHISSVPGLRRSLNRGAILAPITSLQQKTRKKKKQTAVGRIVKKKSKKKRKSETKKKSPKKKGRGKLKKSKKNASLRDIFS